MSRSLKIFSKSASPSVINPPDKAASGIRKSLLLPGSILLVTPFVFLPGKFTGDALNEVRWLTGLVLLYIAIIPMLPTILKSSHERPLPVPFMSWLRHPLDTGMALILTGMFISMMLAPSADPGIPILARSGFLVLAASCIARCRPTLGESRVFMTFLLISMSLQACVTLTQYYSPGLLEAFLSSSTATGTGRSRMIGTIGNPEYVASWLAAGLSATFILLSREIRINGFALNGAIPAYVVVFLLLFLSIFLSGGRGAILSFMIAIAIYFISGMHGRVPKIISGEVNTVAGKFSPRPLVPAILALILLVITGLTWISQTSRDRDSSLPSRLVDMVDPHSSSMRHRVGLLMVTSKMIIKNPLWGTGPGFYGAGFYRELERQVESEQHVGWWALAEAMSKRYVDRTHCDPLQWWAEFGLLPFLGLLWIVIGSLVYSRRYWLDMPQAMTFRTVHIFPAIWGSVLTLSINMWVSFPLQTPVRAISLWVLLGFCGSVIRVTSAEDSIDYKNTAASSLIFVLPLFSTMQANSIPCP